MYPMEPCETEKKVVFLLLSHFSHNDIVSSFFFPSLSLVSIFHFLLHICIRFLHLFYLDPRTTSLALDNFTGSIYIVTTELTDDEQQIQSMLTSPRANSVDHLIPSHHVALITQPVLGARSRSRKKPTNIPEETSRRNKANTHRGSYNDSPSLVIPAHRV